MLNIIHSIPEGQVPKMGRNLGQYKKSENEL